MKQKEFELELERLMTKAVEAGLPPSTVTDCMIEYSGYARMYLTAEQIEIEQAEADTKRREAFEQVLNLHKTRKANDAG